MPQLDIMSFSTQIFWVLVCLSFVYSILIKFVLPDLLLVMRIRTQLIKRLQHYGESLKETSKTDAKTFSSSFKHVEEILNNPVSTNKETILLSSFINETFNKQRLDMVAFLNSLDNNNKLNIFAPFLILVAPTDEFLLMISFCFFFTMFYYFFTPVISKAFFKNQTDELLDNFTKLLVLRKQNLDLMYTNSQQLATLYSNSFSALLLYNTLYTTLSIALIKHVKHSSLNEILFSFKPSQTSLDRSKARLMRLLLAKDTYNTAISHNNYNKLHLLFFILKHVNNLNDPFTQITTLSKGLKD